MLTDKIRGSKIYQEKLVHTPVVIALKKGKKELWNLKNRAKTMLGLQERYPKLIPFLEKNLYLNQKQASDDKDYQASVEESIDVIIPIYNGYEYLLKLFEDLPRAGLPCRFLLIDDCSPDERVQELEKQFVNSCENAYLFTNEQNLGFVGTVNRGLKESKGHVALVNTDTELPEGWLYRLMRPILTGDKVCSSTPYSNSATIFSFPNFCYNNPIYKNLPVEKLDSYFKLVRPGYVPVPTGVGFCMGMSRQAIDEVGILDEETFGRGYGEENDWCQRAIKAGYKNVFVEDLFVYHKHGGSFVSEEKQKLIEEHTRILRRMHPNYDPSVSEFIRKDVDKSLRQVLELVIDTHETKSILYFNHSLGGGATSYMEQQKTRFIEQGACVTVIFFNPQIQSYIVTFENERGCMHFELSSMEELERMGEYLHFDEIYINELVLFPYLWKMQETVLNLYKKQENAKLIMLCHDLFAICPSINLVSESMVYCNMPDKEQCDKCFLEKRFVKDFDCANRQEWNTKWGSFLEQCTEVRTFSEDTLRRMKAVYGDKPAYTLVPHTVSYMFPIDKQTKITKTLNIGLLGMLTVHKGGVLVGQLLDYIEKNNLNIRIILLGKTEKMTLSSHSAFSMTGAYATQDLPELVYENDIDLFFISSVWPETFSYTAEEIMKMNMPVLSLDLGAPAQRIASYERGLVIKPGEGQNPASVSPEQILEKVNELAEREGLYTQTCEPQKVLYIAEDYSFTTRYRLQHLQEELLHQGVRGELYITAKLPGSVNWSEIASVVVYRCRKTPKLCSFIAEAKKNGVDVICDMDDYIFNYEAIKDLAFLKDNAEEYRNFDEYCDSLRGTMLLADRYIVSTNHMKLAVEENFPEKEVFVNRNAASSKMLVLSAKAKAKRSPEQKTNRFVLGYFSGSHTHNRDFALIADVVAQFMKQHSDVYLQITGCLKLPEQFDSLQDRIITYGFMDWQKLPEIMAQIHVNLMPLEDGFFHRCKSENKWMEAGLVGVPTVGSYNEEIAGATRPGENILLCKKADQWMEALCSLHDDRKLGQQIGESAFREIAAHKTTLVKNEALKDYVLGKKDSLLTVITEKKTENLSLARGKYVVFLSGDELLHENAFQVLLKELKKGNLDMVYTDEDSLLKPGWSPDLALEFDYVGPFTAYETKRAVKIAAEMDEIQDFSLFSYDFMLRFTEQKDIKIGRIEQPLYDRGKSLFGSKETDIIKRDALQRRGYHGTLETLQQPECSRVVYEAPKDAVVSIVIPSKDNPKMLGECLKSVRECCGNIQREILIVDNGSSTENRQLVEKLAQEYEAKYLYEPMEFHFSKMCNLGARAGKGDYLLFLNDDVVLMGQDALARMLGQAALPHTGAVGAKLLFPEHMENGVKESCIQHDGIVLAGENPSHALWGISDEQSCYFGRNRLSYNYLAVTAACLMIKKTKFEEAGGFEESLPVAYNDVALGMKLYELGYYQVVRNDVAFTHKESASRGYDAKNEEKNARLLREREQLYKLFPEYAGGRDPFYNVNFSRDYTDFRMETKLPAGKYNRLMGTLDADKLQEVSFQGYIDSVDSTECLIKGWYYYKSPSWMKRSEIYVVLMGQDGRAVYYNTTPFSRPDVNEKLMLPDVEVGFGCRISDEYLKKGEKYKLGLLLKTGLPGQTKFSWQNMEFIVKNRE